MGGVIAVLLVGCSSSSSSPPFKDCAIGALTGTWHVTYVETDGNCGPLNAETVVISSKPTMGGSAAACTFAASDISADRCTLDSDFTCPLNGGVAGSQRWIGTTHQIAAGEMSSTWTLSLSSPSLGSCRSTYAVDWTKL